MEDNNVDTPGTSIVVQCVQYLISHHMKNKRLIRKDNLLKTVFKGHACGKNYDKVMEEVMKTLKNVYGFSLSYIKHDKQFMIVNNIENIVNPEIRIFNKTSKVSVYHVLLKPILCILIMREKPISEGEMWNIVEIYCLHFNLDVNLAKAAVKNDFVSDLYLAYKGTDETTLKYDPEKIGFWFSLGPRGLVELDKMAVLRQTSKLYKVPPSSFKRVYALVN